MTKMTKKKSETYLTKSRFMSGQNCTRRLWLGWHEPVQYTEAEVGSPQAIGTSLGQQAQKLFAGGTLIDEKAWQHEQAVKRTADCLLDKSVLALFEGAFEYNRMRARVDVLERMTRNRWRLWEVKSSKAPKDEHLTDLAFQAHVLRGAGIKISEIGIVHVNGDYIRGDDGIDWPEFFAKTDVSAEVNASVPGIASESEEQFKVLRKRKAPVVPPSKHCDDYCDHWDRCTANKPDDWIIHLPRLSAAKFEEFTSAGIESIADIPDNSRLTSNQEKVWSVHRSNEEFISPDLWKALEPLGPPAYHLDFETMSPAVPLYVGTSPYQAIPFQWSVHHIVKDGSSKHFEYLADGQTDPRRELAETLISALGQSSEPILMYTGYERTVIKGLISAVPGLKKPLLKIIDRLMDLKAVVSGYYYNADFMGSYSLKSVGPALADELSYDDLDDVADGMAAANTFAAIVSGLISDPIEIARLRKALLVYCKQDTWATVEVQKALIAKCRRSE
jgi:predicted RecB family nuclease